jgi:hypothetical protein
MKKPSKTAGELEASIKVEMEDICAVRVWAEQSSTMIPRDGGSPTQLHGNEWNLVFFSELWCAIERNDHEDYNHRSCDGAGVYRWLGECPDRSAQRPRFHLRRSRGKFRNPGRSPTTGSSMKSSRSGSGTSTSGGSDANGDQGRDKMPDSSQGVRPLNKQNKPDRME